MAKQTTKDVREKKGFVLYADDLVAAEELLPDFERRGQLLSMITAYTTGNKLPQVPDLVRASFVYIRNGIIANNAKYDRKREKQAEYNQRQREKLERLAELERAKKSQVEQAAQISQATQSTTNNSINNGNGTGNGIDNGYGINNGNRHGNSNGSENTVNSISPNTEYLKNNSLSENKYTLDEVREILERERIFLKNNWLREFYLLNNVTYKWKYDPISAALAFIRLHPEATKGENKENFPPSSAAPPEGAAGAAYSEMEASAYRAACELWDAIYKEIRPKIRDEDSKFLSTNIRPDIAWRQGYTTKCLRFVVKNDSNKPTFAELTKEADGILVPQHEAFTKYGVKKIYYRPETAEGTKKDVNG